jgi:hypothetical protein
MIKLRTMENSMSRKPAEHEGSKAMEDNNQSHKPAKHIEETAKLASSVEIDKNPEKVREAGPSAKKPG